MARKLSPLTATLVLDINKWSAGIKQVQRDGKALEASLKPISNLSKQWGTALAAAGALVGGTLLAMSKQAADFGDKLLEASQKTGVSTQQLSAFKLMADQSGSSFESLSKGVGLLSKNIVAAAAGSKEQSKIFSAMGIAVKDAGGHIRNTSDIMENVADVFAKMEDGSLKTALAMKLFGKAGADLIPTLNQGSEGIRKAREQTEKFGIALDKTEAALGDKFNDALTESKAAMQGFANAIGVALLPGLTSLVNKANDWIAAASRWTKAHPELTKAIAGTSAIIFGAGGLLLGLSAVLTIAPKLYQAVMLLSTGYKSLAVTMQAVQLLGGVKTFADFSAGISLIGSTSVAATAGLIGLAAAAGFAVGSLVNYAIELAGIQKQADDFIVTAARVTGLGFLTGNMETTGKGDLEAANRVNKALEAKAKLLGKTPAQLQAEATARSNAQRAAQATGAKKTGAGSAADLEKLLGAFNKTGDGASKAASQIDQMWAALKKEKMEAADVEAVLARAYNAHLSLDTIADVLGGDIADIAQEFINAQKPLPEFIGYYNSLIKSSKELAISQEELEAEIVSANKAAFASAEMWKAEGLALQQSELTTSEIIPEINDSVQAILAQHDALNRSTKDLHLQQVQLGQTAQKMIELSKAGYTTQQIEAMLGTTAEKLASQMKDLGGPMDAVTRKTLQQMAAADKLKDAWGQAFGNIVDRLVDMIVDFDFSFKKLKDLGISTAKDMARSFLDGFFKPFKDKLTDLGAQAGKFFADLAFGSSGGGVGGKQGQSGGLLGNIIGAGSGGILDRITGGGNNGPMSERIPGIGGSGGGVGQLTGLAANLNPINMGVSIANQAWDLGVKITDKIGKGRDSANEIVKSQNAFQKTLDSILSDSGLSSTNKLKQVGNVWEAFQANLARFSAAGGEGGVTANQAFATVSPLISRIQADLMKAGAGDGAVGGGGNEFNITVAPVFNFDGEITDLEIKDHIIPTILTELESGVRGTRERLSQIVLGPSGTTPNPVGI